MENKPSSPVTRPGKALSASVALFIVLILISGCASSPPPAKPGITGIKFYSDPPDTNKNVYFLSEINNAKGCYYESSVVLETRLGPDSTNETRRLQNGSVPNGKYAFRCDLGNFTPARPDEVVFVNAVVEVWSARGGKLKAGETAQVNFSSPLKTEEGVYLNIEKIETVDTPDPNNDVDYTVYVTVRNDGYRTALKENITVAFEWMHFIWDNGSLAPGESKAMWVSCSAGWSTIQANYNRVDMGTVEYEIK